VSKLVVRVDGEAMPEAEARAFWERFSAHMETNRGDLSGFAAKEGYASVHPALEDGAPVLLASRAAPQRPYVNASAASPVAPGGAPRGSPGSGRRRRRR
jgi:hypothetical protein